MSLTVKLSYEEKIIDALYAIPRKRGEDFLARAQKEFDAIRAILKPLYEENRRMREALQIQDPRNATARYDMIADAFYRETRMWAPGRSVPLAVNLPEEEQERARQAWRGFVDRWHERFFDEALGVKK